MKSTKEEFKDILENKVDWTELLIEIATSACNRNILIFNDGTFATDHTGYQEDEILGAFSPSMGDRQDEDFAEGWADHDEVTGNYITHENSGSRNLTPDEMVIECIEEGDHIEWIDHLKIDAFIDYFPVEGYRQHPEIETEYFEIEEIDIVHE